jgi:hypothetical protein
MHRLLNNKPQRYYNQSSWCCFLISAIYLVYFKNKISLKSESFFQLTTLLVHDLSNHFEQVLLEKPSEESFSKDEIMITVA